MASALLLLAFMKMMIFTLLAIASSAYGGVAEDKVPNPCNAILDAKAQESCTTLRANYIAEHRPPCNAAASRLYNTRMTKEVCPAIPHMNDATPVETCLEASGLVMARDRSGKKRGTTPDIDHHEFITVRASDGISTTGPVHTTVDHTNFGVEQINVAELHALDDLETTELQNFSLSRAGRQVEYDQSCHRIRGDRRSSTASLWSHPDYGMGEDQDPSIDFPSGRRPAGTLNNGL